MTPNDRDVQAMLRRRAERGGHPRPDAEAVRAIAESRPRRRWGRPPVRLLAPAGVLLAVVLVAVVSVPNLLGPDQRPATAPSPIAGTTTTPTASPAPPSVTASATPTASPVSAVATPVPGCSPDDTQLSVEGWTVTGAKSLISVALRNTGPQACAVRAPLPMLLLDEDGNELGRSASPPAGSIETLDPGDALAGVVDWSSWCPPGTPAALAVSLSGGDRAAERVAAPLPARLDPPGCQDEPLLAPFVALRDYVYYEARFQDALDALEDVSLRDEGRTLVLTFMGAAPYRKGDGCFTPDYAASVLSKGDELEVGAFGTDTGTPVRADECAVEGVAMEHTIEVELAAPFGFSKVRDLADERVHLVAPPDGLGQLTALPAGWELRRQDDGGPSRTGTWTRTYSPLQDPPIEGRHSLVLYQALGAPPQIDTFGERRVVLVDGKTAELYRHGELRRLTLVWYLHFDGMALIAHEADFSEEELIKLAESAVPPSSPRPSPDPSTTPAEALDTALRNAGDGDCIQSDTPVLVDLYDPDDLARRDGSWGWLKEGWVWYGDLDSAVAAFGGKLIGVSGYRAWVLVERGSQSEGRVLANVHDDARGIVWARVEDIRLVPCDPAEVP